MLLRPGTQRWYRPSMYARSISCPLNSTQKQLKLSISQAINPVTSPSSMSLGEAPRGLSVTSNRTSVHHRENCPYSHHGKTSRLPLQAPPANVLCHPGGRQFFCRPPSGRAPQNSLLRVIAHVATAAAVCRPQRHGRDGIIPGKIG